MFSSVHTCNTVGALYLLCVPSGYLPLVIYSLCNTHVVSSPTPSPFPPPFTHTHTHTHRSYIHRHIVELFGPNFQQKFAFWGRSMKFGVEIHLSMLYLKIDRSKTC